MKTENFIKNPTIQNVFKKYEQFKYILIFKLKYIHNFKYLSNILLKV